MTNEEANAMTTNYSKTFFSEARANKFAEQLKANGAEDIRVWGGKDGFGQTQYTVKWNLWK